eukprot:TRINITY_DN982_c0_g1_i1.p1 TRINITY_DN982_c0_g1~~TRINITY_DN982_c0_g1_i1.p1  ORF type:complete len:262 (-),score=48.45 TRINITY_DN982_c0_g1_i1:80-865(-)
MSDDISSGASLVRYCHLARTTKGRGVTALIGQALANPHTFVFGELLEVPSVQQLDGENKVWYDTLTLFAYGTYAQYKESPSKYADLSPVLVKKLKQLSVVSIASVQKSIPYKVLLSELALENVRELEDLIIDCMYANIIKGKLDQEEQRFHVDWAMGRDIRPGQIEDMIKVLSLWCEKSDTLMQSIQEKIQLANLMHDSYQKQQKEYDARVEDAKVLLKAQQEADQADYEGVGAFEGVAANKGKGNRKNKGGPDRGGRRKI